MAFILQPLLVLLFLASATGAWAQGKLHPSFKVAEKYLTVVHLHQWEAAADLMEKRSLATHKKYQRDILLNAPTISDELKMLRALNLNKISDLDEVSPREVYIRRGKARTKRLPDLKTHLSEMKKTLAMKTLGTVPENDDTVHVVIRMSFATRGKAVSDIIMVTLVAEGTAWRVSLDAQEPKITNIAGEKK